MLSLFCNVAEVDKAHTYKGVIAMVKEILGDHIVSSPKLLLTKSFNPAEFLGDDYIAWKGPADGDGLMGEKDIDPRSLVFTEIDPAKFIFETCLRDNERLISGEERACRLKKENPKFIRFGGNVFTNLWKNYQVNKKNSVLEWIHLTFGVRFMEFQGLILRDPCGRRCVLCLGKRADDGWYWDEYLLDDLWSAGIPSVGYKL